MFVKYSDGTQTVHWPDTPERAAMIVRISGVIVLSRYNYPLPDGLTVIEGDLYLNDYQHPLPKNLKHIWGNVIFGQYKHCLPDGLETIRGELYLKQYNQPLPPWIISAGEAPDGRSCYAMYQYGHWIIHYGNRSLSLHAAVKYQKEYDEDVSVLINLLIEQIHQSPLK